MGEGERKEILPIDLRGDPSCQTYRQQRGTSSHARVNVIDIEGKRKRGRTKWVSRGKRSCGVLLEDYVRAYMTLHRERFRERAHLVIISLREDNCFQGIDMAAKDLAWEPPRCYKTPVLPAAACPRHFSGRHN